MSKIDICCKKISEEIKKAVSKADHLYIHKKFSNLPSLGWYKLTEEDLNRISTSKRGSKIFFDRLNQQLSSSELQILTTARKAVSINIQDLEKSEINSKEVFIITKEPEDSLIYTKKTGVILDKSKMNEKFWNQIKISLTEICYKIYYKKKVWKPVLISAGFRDQMMQARDMLYLLRVGINKLAETYPTYREDLFFISYLYYTRDDPFNQKQVLYKMTKNSLFFLSYISTIKTNFYKNDITIVLLIYEWLGISGLKSPHMFGNAIDISQHNPDYIIKEIDEQFNNHSKYGATFRHIGTKKVIEKKS
ncbi:MAG: hypothetical protein ACRCVW_06515 [Brevinema sp.]